MSDNAGAGTTRAGWRCPTCNAQSGAEAAWCSVCGEQRLHAPDTRATLARWWRSLRALVLEPGQLTAEHRDGRRRPWIAPLSLFLAMNLVFFIGQAATGLHVLSIPLSSHVDDQVYSPMARDLLERRLHARPLERARFEDRFQLQQETLAKATVIAMTPLLALASWILFARRASATTWRTHLVFALHFCAFMLLFLTVFFALLAPALLGLRAAGVAVTPDVVDSVATALEAVVIGAYQFVASGRVYGGSVGRRVLGAAVFVYAALGVLYLHRLAVFVVTVWIV